MQRLEQLAAMSFAPLLLLVGCALTVWAGRRVWFARRCRRWRRADGVVICSEVREDTDNDGGVWFAPYVEYSFEVGGRLQTGSDLMFGFLNERFATRIQAQKRAGAYPVGTTVHVAHHPDKPSVCVLEPKLDFGVYGILIFGIVLGLAGVWILAEMVLT